MHVACRSLINEELFYEIYQECIANSILKTGYITIALTFNIVIAPGIITGETIGKFMTVLVEMHVWTIVFNSQVHVSVDDIYSINFFRIIVSS